MSTPVNLNKARKARARTERKAKADENAVKFGSTKAEKAQSAQLKSLATRQLDGHRRDDEAP